MVGAAAYLATVRGGESFDMMMPRRGRMAVLVGEVVEGLDGLLNRIFFNANQITNIEA